MQTEKKNLEGLGGWLILVGISLFVSPIRLWIEMTQIYQEMKSNGSWELIMSGEADMHYPGIKALILGEIAINSVQIIACIVLIILFFMKKKLFPMVFIAATAFNVIFLFVDSVVASSIMPDEFFAEEESGKEIARSFMYLAIWGTYMLVSKRVKATFIH